MADRTKTQSTRSADVLSARSAARTAGLVYSQESDRGLHRVRSGRGFHYVGVNGRPIRDRATLDRIRALAIPPAWTEVWICPKARGHLQATGRDARGRKQYRYHARWRATRDEAKFNRMLEFGRALPKIRSQVASDLRRHGLSREKVLAAVIRLLETTLIRVGNEEYCRENHSFGLTTLRDRHAHFDTVCVRFEFRGKSGKRQSRLVHDERLVRIVRRCRDLPGQALFQYRDERGKRHSVTSSHVNNYLREITGREFTAKDFRTWAATVFAAQLLCGQPGRRPHRVARQITVAIAEVADRLGNTPAICRKCYIAPVVFRAFDEGRLSNGRRGNATTRGLRQSERAVLALLAIERRSA